MTTKYLALTLPGQTSQITPPAGIPDPNEIDLSHIISFVVYGLTALGIIFALFFLIWGGITWITSGGDKEKVDKAQKTIVMAVAGLVLIFLAFVIINFIGTLLGVDSLSNLGTTPTQQSGTQLQ